MKYISYLRYILILVSIVVVAMGVGADQDVDAMLWFAQGLTIVTLATLVVMSIYTSAQNPKSAGRSLIGLLIIMTVLGVSYAMADTTPIITPAQVFDNKTDLLITDTGLFATYIVSALAVLSIAGTEFYNLIKK